MDKPIVIQKDHDAAAPFQGALAGWFLGKRSLAELLPEAFAEHRIASQAELVEVLRPFAEAADKAGDAYTDDKKLMHLWHVALLISLGDLRRASAALSHTKGESK